MKPKTVEDYDFLLAFIDSFFHIAKHWNKQKISALMRTVKNMDENWPEHLRTWPLE